MAKKTYRVASPEGAAWAGPAGDDGKVVAVGDTIEKELAEEQEQALLAAGWLDIPKGKAGAS